MEGREYIIFKTNKEQADYIMHTNIVHTPHEKQEELCTFRSRRKGQRFYRKSYN